MRISYRHFTQVDVFASRKFEGNPLAVFQSGEGLNKSRMQAIAREMNLSETTFLFPASRDADARVRIFTTREELPFAGHPTLGTAFVLASARPRQQLIRLEMKVGIIPVEVRRDGQRVYLEMQQKDPVFSATVPDRERVAEAVGLSVSDLDDRYPVQVVSTGVPFMIVPLRRREALPRIAPAWVELNSLLAQTDGHFPYYLVTGDGELESRMFDQTFEDPATGSAGGCAAAYLVKYGRRRPDTSFVIHQGRLIARPSCIYASASLSGDQVRNVRVGGYVVPVLEGRLRL